MAKRHATPAAALLGVALAALTPAAATACCEAIALPAEGRGMVDATLSLVTAFNAYKAQHMKPDGRVVDNANGGISHSEGQGYAMLIAAKLGDRDAFDAAWGWAQRHLMVREDNLLAWKWDPGADPRIVDSNNATDGDILVVWALVEAARVWDDTSYLAAARKIALDIARITVTSTAAYGDVFLPGAFGFSAAERADGPVINLSYWVFPAVEALSAVAPEIDWSQIFSNGRKILEDSSGGSVSLPPEWSSLAGEAPAPAEGFDAVFGYNAIRIPLYLAWSGEDGALLAPFRGLHDKDAGTGPFVTELQSGAAVSPLRESGFRAVALLADCALATGPADETRVDPARPSGLYYPDTLNILSAIAQLEKYPKCL